MCPSIIFIYSYNRVCAMTWTRHGIAREVGIESRFVADMGGDRLTGPVDFYFSEACGYLMIGDSEYYLVNEGITL
ncbi:hypothetical protein PanWU01x14_202550 [Parasponia andersonii]|uniref:Uncharacterized protein n=1 Tax=Parasponia andersonii TaxID=3476 RepID=A0A2P5BX61_PARAD|nr:hypothetical protein PanWU01x14_202550 [Parasponia andersonii]